MSAIEHARRADFFLQQGQQFRAIGEYRQAISQGAIHPDLYRNLAIALFDVGLLDDAVAELEKAVEIFPESDLMHLELGILYLAKSRLEASRKQLLLALELNPGSAASYYYLAECLFRSQAFDHAWRAARMAIVLGHPGEEVLRKLRAVSVEPVSSLWHQSDNEYHIRQILVESREEAENIIERLRRGELFEDVAGVESIGTNTDQGGYAGRFQSSELHPEIIEAITMTGVLGDPVIVKSGEQFQIVQRLPPFDFDSWETEEELSGPVATLPQEAAGRSGEEIMVIVAQKQKRKPPSSLPKESFNPEDEPDAAVVGETDVLVGYESETQASDDVMVIVAGKQKHKPTFTVHAGAFVTVEEAERRLSMLLALTLPGYIFPEQTEDGTTLYGLVAVKTDSSLVVRDAVQKLKSLGFDYFINRD